MSLFKAAWITATGFGVITGFWLAVEWMRLHHPTLAMGIGVSVVFAGVTLIVWACACADDS